MEEEVTGMAHRIIVDSCCDVTPEISAEYDIISIPLTINLEDRVIVDDESLDMEQFMADMKNCKGKIGSGAPSPVLYKEAFIEARQSFAVTISSNLSASYSNAMIGKDMALEEADDLDVHVFDSKSAAAGEVLVAVKIGQMIKEGKNKSAIVDHIENFISQMKTYFVLEIIDNLTKNGRIGKVKGKLISVLGIMPIMGSDGDGSIALFSHARGEKQIVEKLTELISKSGRDTYNGSLVISHCNNPGLAGKLIASIKERFHFKDIRVVPTKGISSLYANNKGLIMAF
jgi:DegV family protein with EDD domain